MDRVYNVVRTVEFHGGAVATLVLHACDDESHADAVALGLEEAVSELLTYKVVRSESEGKVVDTGSTMQTALAGLGIVSCNHYVECIPLDKPQKPGLVLL